MSSPVIVTRVAHAGSGDHRYQGYGALTELLGEETETGLLALGIMGRRATPEVLAVLDALAVSMTAADPRIWPLKVSRLVASYGDLLAGFAAGQLAMMGPYMTTRIVGDAADNLGRLRGAIGDDWSEAHVTRCVAEHLSSRARLFGYGIPFRERDERFEALRGFMSRSGRVHLPFWRTQEVLSEALWRERKTAPNICIGFAASLLDVGCTPAQAGALAVFLIEHTMAANAFEAAQQRSTAVQRLPEECVEYKGPAPRRSPRSA
jgi:hypothetical protein